MRHIYINGIKSFNLLKNKTKKLKSYIYLIKSKFLLIIFIFNCICLCYNLYISFEAYNNVINHKDIFNDKIIFKDVDIFSINLAIKPFTMISLYLNTKFKIKENFIIKNIKLFIIYLKNYLFSTKKIIRIYTVGSSNDHYKKVLSKEIIEGLQNKYIFDFTPINPDYLIYDVFSCNHLKQEYDNAIKIAFYTENQIPDFNQADYAIGFDNINYLDRYFRKTTLIWIFERRYLNIKNKDFIKKRIDSLNSNITKKFCAAVISNYHMSNKFRIEFIKELNKYKKVDMGGGYMNNVGGPVQNKTKFLSLYKFSIAMENSEAQGYVTEKILDSLIAGTIPIYYGGYMIDEFINPKAYILIRNEKDIQQKIEYIKKIDNDDNLYKKILNEKLFIDDNIPSLIKKEKINFFNHIFQQEKIKAKRVDNYHFK